MNQTSAYIFVNCITQDEKAKLGNFLSRQLADGLEAGGASPNIIFLRDTNIFESVMKQFQANDAMFFKLTLDFA